MTPLKKILLLVVFTCISIFSYACEKTCTKQPTSPSLSVSLAPQDKAFVQHVKVKFTVGNDGKIYIKNIDSSNPKLKKYVLAKLARLHLKGLDVAGNYNITISFSSKEQLT